MSVQTKKHPLHVGQQNIKTAVAATLTALIYLLIGRNPTFACIGAIFGTGSSRDNSRLNGGNRFFGTIFGGLLGMGLFRLYLFIYPDGRPTALLLAFLFVGVILLILMSRFFWLGGVQTGGVVLCTLLYSTPVENYVSYAVNRIIDTGVGVLIALIVSHLLPRHRMYRILEFLRLRKKEKNQTP